MQEPDEVTEPGAPVLLDGPKEARDLANLAVMLKFYAAQLEEMAGEARRAPLSTERRQAMWHRLRELTVDFIKATAVLAPWNAPRAPGRR
jgi:hypothetical protein